MLQMPQKENTHHFNELLILAQNGDKSAYCEFLTLCSSFLRNKLSRSIRRIEIREEIVQETLIGIHKNLHTFQIDRDAHAWVYGIARFKVADYFRKNPHQFSELKFDVTFEENQTNDVEESLLGLPELVREALVMTKIDGLSTKEAAVKLGIKENALRTRISRALSKLKAELEN